MIDIKKIVEEREQVEKGLLKRMAKEDLHLDEIVRLYESKRELLKEFEAKRSQQNSFNDRMANTPKGSDEFNTLISELKVLSSKVKELESELSEVESKLTKLIEVLPNIPDDDVVAGDKQSNEVIKTVGEKPEFKFEIKDHVEIGKELKLFDFDRATKLSG
ncbi:MAG: hypothetical protein RBS01_02125, partial [Candidatus Dojkabacteria bacterium]|nr:hypothetical protein [Candidatus Dojkabacteria bacterium]